MKEKNIISDIFEIPNYNNEICQNVFKKCSFCGKNEEVDLKINYQNKICPESFYCMFCIRNEFCYNKKHVLSFNFINIFSDIYFRNHLENKSLWLSEIYDLFLNHCKIGLLNPVFHCDTDNGNWFVDFSKVGIKSRQIPIEDVLDTIKKMIDSFSGHLDKRFDLEKIYFKYKSYNIGFFKNRNKSIFVFSPNLSNCGVDEKDLVQKIFNLNFSNNQKKYLTQN